MTWYIFASLSLIFSPSVVDLAMSLTGEVLKFFISFHATTLFCLVVASSLNATICHLGGLQNRMEW